MPNDVNGSDVDTMLEEWDRHGQQIASAIEARRDALVAEIELDRSRVEELNQQLGKVRLRLGLHRVDEGPMAPLSQPEPAPTRRKMTREEQRLVPVIRRRSTVSTAPSSTPFKPEDFATSAEVILAVVAREPDLPEPDLIDRCAPLRASIARASWQAILSRMGRAGKLVASGPRGKRRWRLAGDGVEEKGAA